MQPFAISQSNRCPQTSRPPARAVCNRVQPLATVAARPRSYARGRRTPNASPEVLPHFGGATMFLLRVLSRVQKSVRGIPRHSRKLSRSRGPTSGEHFADEWYGSRLAVVDITRNQLLARYSWRHLGVIVHSNRIIRLPEMRWGIMTGEILPQAGQQHGRIAGSCQSWDGYPSRHAILLLGRVIPVPYLWGIQGFLRN